MSGIKVKQVAHYVIMPEIMPLFKRLFTSGFGYVAFLMAQIYHMVRLIPANHSYLNPQNIGLFSIRHVIAEAANNLVLSRKNIDQMIIFAALLIAITLLALQIVLLFSGLIFGTALAQDAGADTNAIFVTAKPAQDIAFILMDHVFGIPAIFNSCVSDAGTACETPGSGTSSTNAFPSPFHEAMHQLFRFYSTGMLAVGTLIFLYFVVVVVAETATTGTPFGQRFQNIWAPIRLVVALGLLVPVNYGLNASQYIALFAGKIGSSFATNAWRQYNTTLKDRMGDGFNPTGEIESLLGLPETPDVSPLVQTMSLVHTCAFAYWYTDETPDKTDVQPPNDGFYIKPYLIKQPRTNSANSASVAPLAKGTTYDFALEFYDNSDIIIRFGQEGFESETGGIKPLCGDVRISVKDLTSAGQNGFSGKKIGAEAVQEHFFDTVRDMWFSAPELTAYAGRYTALNVNRPQDRGSSCDFGMDSAILTKNTSDCRWEEPSVNWKQHTIDEAQKETDSKLQIIWNDYVIGSELKKSIELTDEVLDRGWAGAGIWYNTIARINGSFMDSFVNTPGFDNYPTIMETARTEVRRQNSNSATLEQFQVNFAEYRGSDLIKEQRTIAQILSSTYIFWNKGNNEAGIFTSSGLQDTINLIFGTKGLFSMTRNNNHVHPLAQLSMLGKGLVEASIRNVAGATIGSGVGGLFSMIDNTPGALVEAVSGFIVSTAFIGLTAGLVLFYILPFLPFVYFFFAVGEWVKAIFEAMVGAPLWALAHLRLDGDGLPGSAASNGYFLILEIALRPILTVFGLVAATLIFTAQLRILNFTWKLVTENLAGFANEAETTIGIIGKVEFERSEIDQFFFTIIYAIIAYMMAIAAFKLINKIPDNILRWIGASVSSFGDINQDPVDGLTRFAALGGVTAGQQLAQGTAQLGGGLGKSLGSAVRGTGGPR